MPLPNPNVLDGFIDLYKNYRQKDTKPMSMSGKMLTAAGNVANSLIGGNTDTQIIQICNGMKNKFKEKYTVEKWLEVAHDLAESALASQKAKSPILINLGLTEPDSKLCNTLHALRTYIIHKITSDADLLVEYLHIINKELQALQKLKEKLISTREEHNDVAELSNDLEKKLLKLAHLGHRPAIHEAIDRKLLTDLPRLYEQPSNMPNTFYVNYFITFYDEVFRFGITGESFLEWESKRIRASLDLSLGRSTPSPVNVGLFSPKASQEDSHASSSEEATSDIPPPPPPIRRASSRSTSHGDPN